MDEVDAKMVADMNKSFSRGFPPLITFLKGAVTHIERASNTVTLTFQTSEAESGGFSVQGGISAAMCDASCSACILLLTKLEHGMTTYEQKCTYLAPVRINETVTVCARVLKIGKRVAFVEATLSDAQGITLVTSSQTCMLIPGPRAVAWDPRRESGASL